MDVGSGVAVGVGSGVFVDVGSGVAVGVGSGVFVGGGSGVGVGVGSGVDLGSGCWSPVLSREVPPVGCLGVAAMALACR